ncbi:MAG TPA: Calx-beta domain-containing protein, partial [Thermoanaerobaculia bacterium]|nr:Calx-beta domain-containing protein [Thermoanaerobaculia bacterium]
MRRALLALCLFASLSASAATYEVNDLGDAPDATSGDNICATAAAVCTLRAAIQEANAHAGDDVVEFSVAGVIAPATALPSITGVTAFEGRSAPGYVAAPVVLIDGAGSSAIGLHFAAGSDGSELIALQLSGFSTAGVLVDANDLLIRRNYLGPVLGGTPNGDGLQLNGSGTRVGGADDGGNVISGNTQHGILATGSDHEISDNFIGTSDDGTAGFGNGDDGINIDGAATGIVIGGPAGEENVISGNFDSGVQITDGSGIVIAGNFIGLDATGTAAIPNAYGVAVESAGNVVGTPTLRNVISGNDEDGIYINSPNTLMQNNLIGPDVTGAVGIGNGAFGISAEDTTGVTIGGDGTNEGNVISFNGAEGIFFVVMETSSITGNIIGLDALGTSPLGNGFEGILLLASTEITVASNVISGNGAGGIVDAGGLANIYELNRVGTTADGSLAAANLGTGIELAATEDVIVRSNVVSANEGHGIETTAGAIGTVIHSNIAGLSADLSTPLGNSLDGINVCDGSSDTVVGSVALGGNIISANLENGLGVEPTALTNNTWAANSIYGNVLLGIDIGIDGVTPNDPDDLDEGPNHFQNFPALDSAVTTPGASQVRGTIDTRPSTAFTIHFYSSPTADPSGFGEGRTYLGAVSGTTDANGDAAFVFNGPALTAGHVVTATATTVDGTSEFSAAEAIGNAPTVSFSSATYSVAEGGVSATITVTRSGDLSAVSTVDYATSNNTATAGVDYTATSGTVTFLAGDASETFIVPIANDTTDEPDELVNLTLSNALGATLAGPSSAILTVTDDDNPPAISIGDLSRNEGTGGTTAFTFDVTLSGPSGFTVTVDYATANGTADAGSDYTALATSTLTFTPGQTSRSVTVNVAGDTTFEPNETFFVNLTNPANATIADAQGLGTIVNDDPQPTVTINDVALGEGNAGTTNFVFTLTLSAASGTDVTVNYTTAAGTATAGVDYTTQTGVATIGAGTLSTTITVPVTGDMIAEADETFFVNLTGATDATIADNQALGTILNDEAVPTVAINDISLAEGNAGTTNFTFTVTLSGASATDVTVNYTTANGTATAGVDYAAQSGVATITAGTLSTTITVPVSGDVVAEPDETFFVNLTGATNAAIADNQGLGTIVNDEGVPTLTINDVALAEGNAGSTNF